MTGSAIADASGLGIMEIEAMRKQNYDDGFSWATTHQGAPGPPGVPWWVVPTLGRLSGTSLVHLVSSGPEKFHKKFCCVWTPFDMDFL